MYNKSNTKFLLPQARPLPAGLLPGDFGTELFGCRDSRKVFALVDGRTIPFTNINPALKARIFEKMLGDNPAMNDLKGMDENAALEEFAFCLFGDADHKPDFTPDGTMGEVENFRCSGNCRCLKWNSKQIRINGNTLTRREIEVADKLASDKPDKLIAQELHMSTGTLSVHKRNIYSKAGVLSRPGLLEQAYIERVVL
ncbi:helix-turn-helix domain-containing protein [Flavobacterium rhizosphaerae]|uniref:Helix-turn-helix transcriptional regulator n=1 Tax=Flavobacterium rhizosphaerae TaxID=3163298 RepID=A0ABW8YWJ9_9FLAO